MPEELYLRARRVLLDAAEALHPHLDSVVLVGAQEARAVPMSCNSRDVRLYRRAHGTGTVLGAG